MRHFESAGIALKRLDKEAVADQCLQNLSTDPRLALLQGCRPRQTDLPTYVAVLDIRTETGQVTHADLFNVVSFAAPVNLGSTTSATGLPRHATE